MSAYRNLKATLLVHATLLSSALAAPPANDRFADAFTLTKNVASPGYVAEATLEPGEKVHHSAAVFGATGSVWWKWTAPVSGLHTLSAQGYYYFTLLSVSTGDSVEALSVLAENNIHDSAQSDNLSFLAVAGTVYHISLAAMDYESDPDGSLLITDAPPPPENDDFTDAFPLLKDVTAAGTSLHATLEPGEFPFQRLWTYYGYTVWWKWTAPASGSYDIHTSGGDSAPIVTVWTGNTADSLESAGSSHGDGSGRCRFRAEGGTVYHIAVAEWEGSAAGPVSLKIVDTPEPPINDDFANRAPLTTGTAWIGTTDRAGAEPDEPAAPIFFEVGSPSVWFTWTAPSTGWFHFASRDPESGFEQRALSLWSGGSLDTLRFLHGNREEFEFKAVEGAVYQLRLAGQPPSANGEFGSRAEVLITHSVAPAMEIIELSATPSPVDVTSDARTVTVTFTIVSTLPVTSGKLEVYPKAPAGFLFSAAHRIAGDALRGTYSVPLHYARHRTPAEGFFQVLVYTEDGSAYFGPDESYPISVAGVPSLTLINTGEVDGQPPVLSFVSLSTAKINLSGADRSIVVTAKAADALSGVSTVRVSLHEWWGGIFASIIAQTEMSLIAGTLHDGTFQGTLHIPEWAERNLYRLRVTVNDGNGYTIGAYSDTNAFPGPFRGTVLIGNLLTYPDWAKEKFSPETALEPTVSGQSADPDNDGRTNFMEYALVSSPVTRDPVSPFSFHQSEYGMELQCPVGRYLADAYHFFEQADSPEGPWVPFPQQSVGFRSSEDTITYNWGIPLGNNPRKFFRLRVSGSL